MKSKAQNYVKWKERLWLFKVYILLLPLLFSCKGSDSGIDQFDPNAPVEVTAIIPETGLAALPLVIHGKNFGTDKSKIKVLFDNTEAQIITVKNEHLYLLTPRQSAGEHTVKVIVDGKEGVLSQKFNYIVTSSVTTVAGSGIQETDDGSALEANFAGPNYISVDDKGNILVSDYRGYYLRLVSLNDNKVSTLINNEDGVYGTCFSPDYSTLYVAIENKSKLANEFERNSSWLRTVIQNPFIDKPGMSYGAPAVAVNSKGDVFYIGYMGGIVKKNRDTDQLSYIGQISSTLIDIEADGDGVDYYAAYNPKDDHIYISTKFDHVIIRFDTRKETLTSEDFEIYAGVLHSNGLNNGTRLSATFNSPKGIAFDSKGNMYIADSGNNVIRMITPEGHVSTLAGKPEGGHKDGAIEEALFKGPSDVTVSPEDFIYVADYNNYRIRCIAIQ